MNKINTPPPKNNKKQNKTKQNPKKPFRPPTKNNPKTNILK